MGMGLGIGLGVGWDWSHAENRRERRDYKVRGEWGWEQEVHRKYRMQTSWAKRNSGNSFRGTSRCGKAEAALLHHRVRVIEGMWQARRP